jgi:hypothetical protein
LPLWVGRSGFVTVDWEPGSCNWRFAFGSL